MTLGANTKRREKYQEYLRLGICTCCQKNKSIEGTTRCYDCRKKDKERYYNGSKRQRGKKNICVICREVIFDRKSNAIYCKQCADMMNKERVIVAGVKYRKKKKNEKNNR